jgi:protein arginine kinase activator
LARFSAKTFLNRSTGMVKVIVCDCCGAPATVYLMQVSNGSAARINLCAGCAREKGVVDDSGSPADALLRNDIFPAMAVARDAFPLVCESCGFSGPNLAERKLLGCDRCYETFGELLEPILKRLQRGSTHCGKRPLTQVIAIPSTPAKVPREREGLPRSPRDLETLLRLAIAEERYEDAARIRDRLASLRKTRPTRRSGH